MTMNRYFMKDQVTPQERVSPRRYSTRARLQSGKDGVIRTGEEFVRASDKGDVFSEGERSSCS